MTVRVLLPQRIEGEVPEGDIAMLRGRSMGSSWSATFVSTPATNVAALAQGIEAVLMRVIEQMSTWEQDSAITRFNHAPSGSWLPMPPEFALVLACAMHVARSSSGALDPTAGALATLWGFGPKGRYHQPGFVAPTQAAVAEAKKASGWQQLQVDTNAMRVRQPGGMHLDFSAVAKGFAVDEVSLLLRAQGLTNHLVEIGGELRGAGMKPDGQPWWVDVELPPRCTEVVPTRIALHGLSVATSGDYLQGFDVAGRRYSHCIDPQTGSPIDNGVSSVTVVHPMCMQADAWSTALMVLGAEAGMIVADRENLAAQWLVHSGEGVAEYCSRAWNAMVAGAA